MVDYLILLILSKTPPRAGSRLERGKMVRGSRRLDGHGSMPSEEGSFHFGTLEHHQNQSQHPQQHPQQHPAVTRGDSVPPHAQRVLPPYPAEGVHLHGHNHGNNLGNHGNNLGNHGNNQL